MSVQDGSKNNNSEGRRVALVIGVNKSTQESIIPSLRHAETDAQAVAVRLVTGFCGFELYSPPLIGQQATTGAIRDVLLDLADILNENDFLIVYFSGHGHMMEIESGRQDVYLVTTDFKERRVRQDENSHISMRWLQDKVLRNNNIGRVLLILDCCYAGWIGESAPDPYIQDLNERFNYYLNIQNIGTGAGIGRTRLTITSTSPTTTAKENENGGLFTGVFLDGLNGSAVDNDGYVTISSLFQHLKRCIEEHQLPGQYGFDNSSEFNLAYHADKTYEHQRRQIEERNNTEREIIVNDLLEKIITNPRFFNDRSDADETTFDNRICQDASMEDIDRSLVENFFGLDRVQKQDDYYFEHSFEQMLDDFGFLRKGCLTNGFLLCFGKHPQN